MGGLWRFLEENKMDKLFKKENLIMLVLAGILLVVIALPTKEDEKNQSEQMVLYRNELVTQGDEENENEEYLTYLENKLANILSCIKDVGKVYVMITLQERVEERESAPYMIKTTYPRIEGVFVVAQGAGKGSVRQDITEAVQVLFGIDLHRIKVTEYNVQQSHNMN